MSTRVYVPSSIALLREALVNGGVGPAPLHAHAVTEALRKALPDSGEEEWEYAALTAAAQDSLAVLTEDDAPRRVVVVAEAETVVPDDDTRKKQNVEKLTATNRRRPVGPKRRSRKPSPGPTSAREGERLQKVMAQAGIASRRASEELIREGRVTINGREAVLGDRVMKGDAVKVGSKLLQSPTDRHHLYLALHKPEGTMTTTNDPEGRQTVFDLVPHRFRKGLMSVGRLDYGTEGLLLLTTDGGFAQRVAHPSYQCTKTYLVKVKGHPDEKSIERLSKGIRLDGVRLQPATITPHRIGGKQRIVRANSWWKVELTEGRTRQVRRMFERVGHLVTRLRRVQIGPVRLGKLGKGDLRELSEKEVEVLSRIEPKSP